MREMLITNNALVKQELNENCEMVYTEGSYIETLKIVRDYVHRGHKLLSHPLSGSVKPNENPFKSVLISKNATKLDLNSLHIIENSILVAEKFPIKFKNLSPEMRTDFQRVDYALIKSAFCNKI